MTDLDRDGYVVIPSRLPQEVLERAQEAAQRMIRKVEGGKYPFFRIYDDMVGLNISGVEHIFHPDIREPDLFKAVVDSKLLETAKGILGVERPAMLLNRLHVTTKYSHTGNWHRDALPGVEETIQASLFLYPEDRFFVVPRSHRRENTPAESVALWKSVKADLPGQEVLSVKAGDILFFRSAILHRASCVGTRANVHFRLGKKGELPLGGCLPTIPGADKGWTELLSDPRTNCDYYLPAVPVKRLPVWKRLAATVLHHALSFLPESHRLFQRFRWLTPNLRLKMFGR